MFVCAKKKTIVHEKKIVHEEVMNLRKICGEETEEVRGEGRALRVLN